MRCWPQQQLQSDIIMRVEKKTQDLIALNIGLFNAEKLVKDGEEINKQICGYCYIRAEQLARLIKRNTELLYKWLINNCKNITVKVKVPVNIILMIIFRYTKKINNMTET